MFNDESTDHLRDQYEIWIAGESLQDKEDFLDWQIQDREKAREKALIAETIQKINSYFNK